MKDSSDLLSFFEFAMMITSFIKLSYSYGEKNIF